MAVELNTLPSNNINNIDTNFQRVEVALQDAVSRSGNGPNQLTADLDANSQNLLNINRIDVQEFYMDGQPIASIPAFEAIVEIAPDIIVVADISDEIVAVSANAFNINTVGNNIVNINAVANSIDNVNTVASNITAINTSNANSTNINTVATNISSVVTVASNIANVNSVAANIVNVNTVALNIASINTVITNLASIIDAPNQATAAANSATAAAASAASISLPASPVALNYIRRNAANTAYEVRTSAQVITDIGAATAASVTALPFTKSYESAEQVITAGGGVTLTHGLGTAPKIVDTSLVCKVAEQGFAIGDVYHLGTDYGITAGSPGLGVNVRSTATEIKLRFSSNTDVFFGVRPDTGARSQLTNANWRLITRAWA